ncbi:MAG: HEPN domain-containing protein [Nitrospirota bacterium]
MTRDDLVHHWVEQSDRDLPVMETLFSNGHYMWALFVGHLVTEKLLKAYYIKKMDANVPFIHDLTKIADLSGLVLTKEQEDFLDEVTEFNIKARYQDHRQKFYKKATKEFTQRYIISIKEFRSWLKPQLIKT